MKTTKESTYRDVVKNSSARGWFFGPFLEGENYSENVKLKWGYHAKGEVYKSERKEEVERTVSILIRGAVTFEFPEQGESITLSGEGDYLQFDGSKTSHSLYFHEDSVVLTVRFPYN
jgi:hypothetical protein